MEAAMSSIEQFRNELKPIYESLTDKYEGYIQMSDKRIEHIFKIAQQLPVLEDLYVDVNNKNSDVNYIVEMALFEPSSKKSILIRQQNCKWLVLEKTLSGNELMETYFTLSKNTPKMNIAQIWEEESNEFCLDMEVLEAKYLMFAGFKKGEQS